MFDVLFWVFMAIVLPTMCFYCGYCYGMADGIHGVHELFLDEVEDNRLFRELVKEELCGGESSANGPQAIPGQLG